MPLLVMWQPMFAASADKDAPESPKTIACPTVVADGTTASITEVLTRIEGKTEALTKASVEHKAPWNEIDALIRIDVVSNMMKGSALVISRSPHDSKATEVSLDELISHTQFSAKIVSGLMYGDDTLALKRTAVPSAISALNDLHCEIAVLGENVRKLANQLQN